MKHYRNLNGCVSRMHRVIYEAYDKGYSQGRKDYERPAGEWLPLTTKGYIQFACSKCLKKTIAKYLFCPNCGSPMTEDSYGTEN